MIPDENRREIDRRHRSAFEINGTLFDDENTKFSVLQEQQGVINAELKVLIDEARKLEDEKTELAARTKEINKRLDEIARLAQPMFERDGFPEFFLGGYKVSLDLKNCWSVHDKASLVEALKQNPDTAAMVKEDFSKATLDKFLDEVTLADGLPPFDAELVSMDYVKPIVAFKKKR